MNAPFVLIGDLMIDITAVTSGPVNYASDTRAQISVHPGGASANTATWLAHLGESVHLIGALGTDAFATMFRQSFENTGVHLHATEVTDAPTGTCIVIVDSTGERTMLPDPGANSFLTQSKISDSLFCAGSHLHLSGYTLLNPATRAVGQIALARARAGNLTCSLDTASAAPISANPGAIREALGQIDVLLANTDEAAALTGFGDPAQALAALAEVVDTVVIKCGPQGALAAQGNQHVKVPALPTKVVDTTGAGDAFTAGFLVSWRAGAPLTEAVMAGGREATQAISRVGAGPKAL